MPVKFDEMAGIEFCRNDAPSPFAAMAKYLLAVLVKAVRVAASISSAVRHVWAWTSPAHAMTNKIKQCGERLASDLFFRIFINAIRGLLCLVFTFSMQLLCFGL